MPVSRCRRFPTVLMPPAIRWCNRGGTLTMSRVKMREWLEDLLNTDSCPGLQWKDKGSKTFTIEWRHASSQGFNESQHGSVFLKWAEHTKRKTTNHSTNKSNFRCALHSLKDCRELTESSEKRGEHARRTFQFLDLEHNEKSKGKGKGKRTGTAEKSDVPTETRKPKESSRKRRRLSEDSCSSTNECISSSSNSDVFGDQEWTDSSLMTEELTSPTDDNLGIVDDQRCSSYSCSETAVLPQLSLLQQPVLTLKTETAPDGTTTIILPLSNDNIVQQVDLEENTGHSTPSEINFPPSSHQGTSPTHDCLPNFAALGVPEEYIWEELSFPKLTCGGHVKVSKPKELKIHIQLPPDYTASSLAVAPSDPQDHLKTDSRDDPQYEPHSPYSDFNLGMSLDLPAPKEEKCPDKNLMMDSTNPNSSGGAVSAAFSAAFATLLPPRELLSEPRLDTPVVVEALYPNLSPGEQVQLPVEIIDDIFSMENSM